MYHWYAMDLERTIENIREERPAVSAERSIGRFMDGYRSEHAVDDEMMGLSPVFRRFGNLYQYARVLRSAKEKWDNEPEWLEKLRLKFSNILKIKKCLFGSRIEQEG